MRTLEYDLKGKEVPTALAGTKIRIRIPETYKEAESLTKQGETDVVSKFADGYVIALQGKLRTRAGKQKDGALVETAESLQKIADDYIYSVQAEGSPRDVKPATKATRAAASSGNKMFEKALADEKFRNLMVKNGVLDEAEFATWQEARKAAQASTPAQQA